MFIEFIRIDPHIVKDLVANGSRVSMADFAPGTYFGVAFQVVCFGLFEEATK